MVALFRLVRLPNLLVVALTQYGLYTRILSPLLVKAGLVPVLNTSSLVAIMTATCMVAAAGYIINDIHDQPIDAYNEDEAHLVGSGISERTAAWLFFSATIGGFLLSLYLGIRLNALHWLWLFPTAAAFLGVYSYWIKPLPLAGNLLVSTLCAGVAGLILLAERQNLHELALHQPLLSQSVWRISGLFMAYAFWATLVREVVKDFEDMPGDAYCNRRTAPIAWGVQETKIVTTGVILSLLALLVWPLLAPWIEFSGKLVFYYHLLLLALFIQVLVQLWKANSIPAYHQLSQLIKGLMAAGIGLLYMLGVSS